MPGDEVVLAGAGWGAGVSVQFGSTAATVLDTSPTSLKVTVPALEGAPGTEFPVRVASGADTSNPAPFVLGRLPLVISVSPASAAPGDLVTVAGRGFDVKPIANDVRVAWHPRAGDGRVQRRAEGRGAASGGGGDDAGRARAGRGARRAGPARRHRRSRPHRLPVRGRALRGRAWSRARAAGHRPRAGVRAQRERRQVGGGAGLRGRAPAQRGRGHLEGRRRGRGRACPRARRHSVPRGGRPGHAAPRGDAGRRGRLRGGLDGPQGTRRPHLAGRGWPCGGRRWRATSCCSSSAERSRTLPRISPPKGACSRISIRSRGSR